jgi:hypothetical protein
VRYYFARLSRHPSRKVVLRAIEALERGRPMPIDKAAGGASKLRCAQGQI